MISIPRSWIRDLRAVFRRLSPSRNGVPQAVELSVDRNVVVARCTAIDGAAEFRHSCPGPDTQIVVPLDALAACEGKDHSLVVIDSAAEKSVELRWTQNGVPQVQKYDAPEPKATFPAPPTEWTSNALDLLDALDEAVKTTADTGTRYALDRIQFNGSTGELIASDSKHLLIQGGFEFPWKDSVLVSRIGASAARYLFRVEAVHVGRTEGFLWLRTGPWSIALPIAREARYPDVHAIIPSAKADITRLVLDPIDGDMLVAVLPDLPGAEEPFQPVTVDLNGSIAIRATAGNQAQTTELVLERSQRTGPALRFVIDRTHLSRARKLGFDSIDIVAPTRPIVCRNGNRTYVAMPLDEKSAVPATDDVLRVGAPEPVPAPRARAIAAAPAVAVPVAQSSAISTSMASTRSAKSKKATPSNTPIDEAAAIQSDLRNVLGRVRGLSTLIRRQRQQHRLLKATLASLKQLQHVGA